jgi:SAM-dependent methyltransferase
MTIRTAFFISIFLACSLEQSIALSLSSGNIRRQPIGRIAKLDRSKLDKASDSNFYCRPNIVTHTDDKFVSRLNQLYDDMLPQGSVILDMMSSHVSHLPETTKTFARVDVHGMNLDELNANQARAKTEGRAFVRNLNDNSSFVGLCETYEYDAVLCCVGVQYLEDAEAVFAEVARILKPGGVMIVSFTNRFFFQKALTGWVERGMKERARLVTDYFRAAGGFEDIKVVGDGTGVMSQFLSVGGIGGDPFVAVVATREQVS